MSRGRGRVRKATFWVTGDGRQLEIQKMDNEHIINCVAFMQRRKNTLEEVDFDVDSLNEAIKECDEVIEMFAEELQHRDDEGIYIERGHYYDS